MFRVALNIIQQNPLFGTGLNTYSEVMHHYDPKHLIGGFEFPVHNMYLFIAAEIGIPGLLFFLLFLSAIMIQLMKISRNTRGHMAVISIGILGESCRHSNTWASGGRNQERCSTLVCLLYCMRSCRGDAGGVGKFHRRYASAKDSNTMNVLFVTNAYHPIVGGVEKVAARLASELEETGL